MKHRLTVAFLILFAASFAPLGVGPSKAQPPDVVDVGEIHVRMEAVILSDNNGDDPSGVLTVKQLKQWIGNANASFRSSQAYIVLDFDSKSDLARVRNTTINHLNHNHNDVAARQAAQYPGKMVVFFRAYGAAGSGVGVTGNGYTAYNAYIPKGTPGCVGTNQTLCSASYTVMPSVYCGTVVATDRVDKQHPKGPIASDGSGCTYGKSAWYTYQNFGQLTHEVGHYFGLPHTFPGTSDFLSTPKLLQTWYDGTPRSGTVRSIKIYDGDSPDGPLVSDGTSLTSGWTFVVTDTPPDVGASLFASHNISMCNPPSDKTIKDGSGATVTFDGARYTAKVLFKGKTVSLTFKPLKDDVMSYFMCAKPMTFTASQVATMRSRLLHDPQRAYLLCTNPQDAEFKPYMNCSASIPHVIYAHPRNGPIPLGTPFTHY